MAKKQLFQSIDELMTGYGLRSEKGVKKSPIKEPIRLRGKETANGVSLYLEQYLTYQKKGEQTRAKRDYEFLKLYLKPEISKTIQQENESTLRTANAIKAKRIVDIQNGEHGFKTTSSKDKASIIDFIDNYAQDELNNTGNKNSNYAQLKSLRAHLIAFAGDKIIFKQLTSDFIRDFLFYLKTAKSFNCKDGSSVISETTRRKLFVKLKMTVKRAILKEVIRTNPFDKITKQETPKEPEGHREFLTLEEIKLLIATPCRSNSIKQAFVFSCLTGLRYSDLKNLKFSNIKKDTNGNDILSIEMQKVSRNITIPLSNEALKWIPERTNDSDLIFNLTKNDNANRMLKNWVLKAGIEKHITFHCARHTSATLNLSLDIPITTVSALLGHSKVSTTQIYAKIIDSKKREGVEKQNGLFD